MAKEIKTEILIYASPEKIWSILTNFDNYPSWNPFIKSIKGEVKVGNKITARIEPPEASGMTFKPKILTLETNKELRWLSLSAESPVSGTLRKQKTTNAYMKAIIYTQYGSPEVLQLKDVEKPIPKDNEVLIKIHATTVNRTDSGFRKGVPYIVRLFNGLTKPKKPILGSELAGEIEAIGKDVKTFKPGDKVFGLSTWHFGTHAEYICMPEKASITTMPCNMTYEEAAAVCDGLMLAINYIRKINFNTKPKVLVNGASGSIGSAAVQLAKHYGAEVTAVCNTKNLELLKSLGASEVIDYTKDDFTINGQLYDVVLDAVGKSSFFRCKKILKPRGVYFSTELGYLWQNVFFALFTPLFSRKKVKFPIPTDSKEDIIFFKELIELGNYKAVIDRKYPLEQIIEATKYVETEQKTGNVVITI